MTTIEINCNDIFSNPSEELFVIPDVDSKTVLDFSIDLSAQKTPTSYGLKISILVYTRGAASSEVFVVCNVSAGGKKKKMHENVDFSKFIECVNSKKFTKDSSYYFSIEVTQPTTKKSVTSFSEYFSISKDAHQKNDHAHSKPEPEKSKQPVIEEEDLDELIDMVEEEEKEISKEQALKKSREEEEVPLREKEQPMTEFSVVQLLEMALEKIKSDQSTDRSETEELKSTVKRMKSEAFFLEEELEKTKKELEKKTILLEKKKEAMRKMLEED